MSLLDSKFQCKCGSWEIGYMGHFWQVYSYECAKCGQTFNRIIAPNANQIAVGKRMRGETPTAPTTDQPDDGQ